LTPVASKFNNPGASINCQSTSFKLK
jgi:hypothetical protein